MVFLKVLILVLIAAIYTWGNTSKWRMPIYSEEKCYEIPRNGQHNILVYDWPLLTEILQYVATHFDISSISL